MKKKWLLILALAGVMALTGACGSKKEDAAKEEDTVSEAVSEGKLLRLGNYKNVEIEAIDTTVSEEEMQEIIDNLLSAYPEAKPVEGRTAVEDGDIVNIDYVGRKDGEAFEGGTSGEGGYDLTIGSGTFIPGFEEGLVGKEVGGTYELPLTFPEEYSNNPDMAGQDVVFEVTVNYIIEDYVEPEWNDAFVQKNTEYDSVDAYMEATRADYEAYKVEQAPAEKERSVVKAIIADSEFDCEEELKALEESMRTQYEDTAEAYGIDLEAYVNYFFGMDMEEFEQQIQDAADYQLKGRLVVKAIAKAENMEVTEEEYTESLAELAETYGAESPEAFEEQYGRDVIEENLIFEKVLALIVGQAVEV